MNSELVELVDLPIPESASAKAQSTGYHSAAQHKTERGRVPFQRYKSALDDLTSWRDCGSPYEISDHGKAASLGYVEVNIDGSLTKSYLRGMGVTRKDYSYVNCNFSRYGGTIDWLVISAEQLERTWKPLPSFRLSKTFQRFIADKDIKPTIRKIVERDGGYFAITRNDLESVPLFDTKFGIHTSGRFDEECSVYKILRAGLDYLKIRNLDCPPPTRDQDNLKVFLEKVESAYASRMRLGALRKAKERARRRE